MHLRSRPQSTASGPRRNSSRRSTNGACAAFRRRRASSGSNQATRSISGKAVIAPTSGGQRIEKVLLTAAAGSRSPSSAQAWTILPPFWTIDAEGDRRGRRRGGRDVPGLLLELATGLDVEILAEGHLALRDRPVTEVAAGEERAARVPQEHLEPAAGGHPRARRAANRRIPAEIRWVIAPRVRSSLDSASPLALATAPASTPSRRATSARSRSSSLPCSSRERSSCSTRSRRIASSSASGSSGRAPRRRCRGRRRGARNALAMKPVKTLKSATPAVRRKMPMIRPGSVTGNRSP